MNKSKAMLLHYFIVAFCVTRINARDFRGGRVSDDITLKYDDSPYFINEDVIVDKHATLTVEPGVEMMFAPKVMLAVNGTLDARVNISMVGLCEVTYQSESNDYLFSNKCFCKKII